jgi:hypothetical protein
MVEILTPEERAQFDAFNENAKKDTPPVDKYAGTGPLGFVTDITNW